jgi:uncharacterized protein (TIGR00730 family)
MHNPHADRDIERAAICVFCGSSYGGNPRNAEAARRLGTLIGKQGFRLIFGGGNVGLMGETARAARAAGAPVIGILPQFLRHMEPPLKSAEELIITPDLQQRKQRMIAMSDAFVLLPGGLGTFDEFFEVVTAVQLGVVAKPIVLVNLGKYFDPLTALLKHAVGAGFANEAILSHYRVVETPENAIEAVTAALKPHALRDTI